MLSRSKRVWLLPVIVSIIMVVINILVQQRFRPSSQVEKTEHGSFKEWPIDSDKQLAAKPQSFPQHQEQEKKTVFSEERLPEVGEHQLVTPIPSGQVSNQAIARLSSNQAIAPLSEKGGVDIPHGPADMTESGEFSGVSLVTDNGLIPLKWDVPYFDPPEWKIEFNPNREEMERLDVIAEEVNNPNTTEARRAALLAEREAIVKNAQRPTKYIGGVIVRRVLPNKEPDWWEEYHRQNPDQ